MQKIKKGDTVQVITGADKGTQGEVLSVFPKKGKLIVKGVRMCVRHQKPSQVSAGGLIKKEQAIDVSNVMFVDAKDGKPTRVGIKVVDGKKVRFSKRSGDVIG